MAVGLDYNFVVPMRVAPTLTNNSTLETSNIASITRDGITTIGFRFLAVASATGETYRRENLTAAAEL